MKVTLCLLSAVLLISCSSDPSNIPVIDNNFITRVQITNQKEKRYSILDRMKDYNIPGASVAIVQNGKLVHSNAFGVVDVNTKENVTEETQFQASHMSEFITAIAVLKLLEEKGITIDESANSYLKSWKIRTQDNRLNDSVTIRHLLSKTSGLRHIEAKGFKVDEVIPNVKEILEGKSYADKVYTDNFKKQREIDESSDYLVLQLLTEELSNQSFEDYVNQSIFTPLKMDRTTYSIETSDNYAFGHQKNHLVDGNYLIYPDKASHGLWTTPTDMAKLMIEVHKVLKRKDERFLTAKQLDDILAVNSELKKNMYGYLKGFGITVHRPDKQEQRAIMFQSIAIKRFSLNWNIVFKDYDTFFSHGENTGFSSLFYYHIHDDLVFILMANANVTNDFILEYSMANDLIYNSFSIPPREVEISYLNESLLKSYQGKFKRVPTDKYPEDHILEITQSKSILKLYDKDMLRQWHLIPLNDSNFINQENAARIFFNRNENLSFIMKYHNGIEESTYVKQ